MSGNLISEKNFRQEIQNLNTGAESYQNYYISTTSSKISQTYRIYTLSITSKSASWNLISVLSPI